MASGGCYVTHSGSYDIPRGQLGQGSARHNLVADLYAAIRPFGFRREIEDDQQAAFTRDLNAMAPEIAGLNGSRSKVYVTVSYERGDRIQIIVSDLRGPCETPFVAALKKVIEQLLLERYRVPEPTFHRLLDWFASAHTTSGARQIEKLLLRRSIDVLA
jgi:hypothetical protein